MRDNDFSSLTDSDLRLINRMTGYLAEARDLDVLGREFVAGMADILPADCMLWNRWTTGIGEIIDFETNDDGFRDGLTRYGEALNATIHHHPVIAAGQVELTWRSPQRMSDYQSFRDFKSNPLFREVYRHLDSHHQIAYSAARLEDTEVILSWNLKRRDFSDREMQKLHLAGIRVGSLCRRLEETRRLEKIWMALSERIGSTPEFDTGLMGLPLFRERDGRIMAALIRGTPRAAIAASLQWRRDTLDRYLAEMRERLGFESIPQLLHAFSSLKGPASRARPGGTEAPA